jgi:predicted signal transduction protein with EAL and GGDEF domain
MNGQPVSPIEQSPPTRKSHTAGVVFTVVASVVLIIVNILFVAATWMPIEDSFYKLILIPALLISLGLPLLLTTVCAVMLGWTRSHQADISPTAYQTCIIATTLGLISNIGTLLAGYRFLFG